MDQEINIFIPEDNQLSSYPNKHNKWMFSYIFNYKFEDDEWVFKRIKLNENYFILIRWIIGLISLTILIIIMNPKSFNLL